MILATIVLATFAVIPATLEAKLWALDRLGWTQYRCLSAIVEHESGWRLTARNRTSGAYGLPQALPGSKMAVAGADWRTNPTTQLRWATDFYIPARYGTACGAWRFWQEHRWW